MVKRELKEQGAVTVYLIVILAAVFAFVAIFIDFSRMYALQAKAENLSHAASRSVLSSFDQDLARKYGLFAFGETDENYIMSKVLQDSFDLVKSSDGLPLLGAKLESSSTEMLRQLGLYSVFEQQIREQMKYRAPIDLTIELLNRFKPMAQMMKEASNTMDLLGQLQKLYDAREGKLDEMLETQRQAAALIEAFQTLVPRPGVFATADETVGGSLSTVADMAVQYEDYRSKLQEDESREPQYRLYTEETDRYRSEISGIFRNLARCERAAEESHAFLLSQAGELLAEVRQINGQMERVIKGADQHAAQMGYNDVSSGISTDGNYQIGGSGEIVQIREQSDSLLLTETWFADFEKDVDGQSSDYSRFQTAMKLLLAEEGAVLSGAINSGDLKSAVSSAGREMDSYLHKYADRGAGNILDENKGLLDSHRASDHERKQKEREAGSKLEGAVYIMKQITALKDKLERYQKQFNRLETYFDANRTMNHSTSFEGEEKRDSLQEDPYDTGGKAMTGIDNLYGGLSELMKGMTDRGYQTEYIANYFHFFDVKALDELVANSGLEKFETLADQFAPEHQEAEYVLYGFHDPVSNIAAAYGEIFSFRLAIRTMEGFIKNSSTGNPLLILASALLYGIEHAIQDMLLLTKNGKIPLSAYIKEELSYRDYLRLFLFLHGRSERRLSRMLAVIRMNTGIDPGERATYVKGQVTVSMPLWFLPGVAKAMGKAGNQGKVEGSRYYAAKQADFSY